MEPLPQEIKRRLIAAIPWDTDWDDLSLGEKADFCALHRIGYLANDYTPKEGDNREQVKKLYETDQRLIKERGVYNFTNYV